MRRLAICVVLLAVALASPPGSAAAPRGAAEASVEAHIVLKGAIKRLRDGKKVASTRVGDTVLFTLAARNDGPASIPAGAMAFVVTVSDALEGRVSVDKTSTIVKSCKKRTTGFLCPLRKLGHKQVAKLRLRLDVTGDVAGEHISVRFRLGLIRDLPAGLTAFQSPPRFVTLGDDVDEVGGDAAIPPTADVCPDTLRFVSTFDATVTTTASRVYLPVQGTDYVFRCVYRGIDQADMFLIEIDATPPNQPGLLAAGDCDKTRSDEPNAERIVLYSRTRHLTVTGGFRVAGWFLQDVAGGATVHPAAVLGRVLATLEKGKVGAACGG